MDKKADLDSAAMESLLARAVSEFMVRADAGATPEVEAFALRYPDIAEVLRRVLPALGVLRPPEPREPAGEETAERLGDYRLLREIGRGGMGVVYEARQVSLDRRVALKVLPFASTLDPRQLQRFENEARAAAHLQHPNIVPVFAVGCERGVHFYAMQFIEGHTLASLIQQRRELKHDAIAEPTTADPNRTGQYKSDLARPPTEAENTRATADSGTLPTTAGPAFFRRVAELGTQAALALEHAHQSGVVHRDIKPANLILDFQGNLWVADFGLAQFRAGAELTKTGDVVGTLRYMSPEQALAQKGVVDHRTDVYALGTTLYELLTLRPVCDGQDQRELLRQVVMEEPTSPRRFNKAIPADLETVVLKALAKVPEERYATALELADDLDRFLKDEPIRAKPPRLVERMRRWSRRHRHIATSATIAVLVVLAVTVGVLAQSNWRIQQEQELTKAEQAKTEAERAKVVEALASETKAGIALKLALESKQQTMYLHTVALSHREWQVDNGKRARQLLAECPERWRRWEWHCLNQMYHSELLVLQGHQSGVQCVAFSPDGKLLATGGADKVVKVWDAFDGRELRAIPHSRPISSVAFSPDGKRLASATTVFFSQNPGCEVALWDVTTGEKVLALGDRKYSVFQVAFSPDGKRLASADGGNLVRMWDALTGKELLARPGTRVAFGTEGNFATLQNSGRSVKIWDEAGRELLSLAGKLSWFGNAAFSSDGERIALNDSSGTLKVWDVRTGQVIQSLPGQVGRALTAAFSPDGRRVVALTGPTLQVWDAVLGQELHELHGTNPSPAESVFSPDGMRLASACNDGTVRVWDMTAGQGSREIRAPGSVRRLIFSRDGKHLASSGVGEGKVWDTATGKERHSVEGGLPTCLGFRQDGAPLVLVSKDENLKVVDMATGRELYTIRETPRELFPELRKKSGPYSPGRSVALSPDGRLLVLGGRAKTMQVYDAMTGAVTQALRGHPGQVDVLAFSPDSKLLASACRAKHLRIWDAKTGQLILNGGAQPEDVVGFAFSPCSQRLAIAGLKGTIEVVNATSGAVVFTLHAHSHLIQEVAFSPDGQRLVAAIGRQGGSTGALKPWGVKFWDAVTGTEILTLPHASEVLSIAFSPDGKTLASACRDGTILLWEGEVPAPKVKLERQQARAIPWHRQEARYCEAAQHWFGAAWHLDRLLAAEPGDALLHTRIARARLHLGRHEMINAAQALEIEQGLSEADLEQTAFRLGWLYLERRDLPGYRRLCKDLTTRFGKPKVAFTAYLLVRVCTLGPDADDPSGLVTQARRPTALKPPQAHYLHALGAAHYRAGQFEQAIERLVESEKVGPDWDSHVLNWLFLAMSNRRLGRNAEAERWLSKADQWIAQTTGKLPKDAKSIPWLHIHTSLAFPLLRREAAELFAEEKDPSRPKAK